MVQQSPIHPELWHLLDRVGGGSFTMAEVDPACPRYGTTLALSIEIAQRLGAGEVLETGPTYKFVRSLQ
jgi:hypothetical protein